MTLTKEQAGKLSLCSTIDEMRCVASKYDAIINGCIDFRGATAVLHLRGEDLRAIMIEGADLSGSRLVDCVGSDMSFRGCRMRDVHITNEAGTTGTLERADFSDSEIVGSYLGPRTLNMQYCRFDGARLIDTKFMLGSLQGASFTGSTLKDVDFRNADLSRVSFSQARLVSVCMEKATLTGADFESVYMERMEDWGEPDFTGAHIEDAVRYRFAIISSPVDALTKAVNGMSLSSFELSQASEFIEAVREFVEGAPEAMLIYDEYEGILGLDLFVELVKAAKGGQ